MKVDLKISRDIKEPYAVIYTNELTKEVQRLVSLLNQNKNILTVKEEDKIVVLQSDEIYMARVENSKVAIFCEKKSYTCRKRLHEVLELLGKDFMQISKSCVINLRKLDSVEPYFNGMMVKLKNGNKDYISRKYLPNLKNI